MSKQQNILPQALILVAVAAAYLAMRKQIKTEQIPTLITDMSTNPNLPRGYRNNNPLNIDYKTYNHWKGKVEPNTDGRFEQFGDMAYGYRAAFVLLRNYISQGYNTIAKIISRWAPENENNTAGYISRVATMTEIDPNTTIARTDKDSLSKIVYAMSIVENGSTPETRAENLPNMQVINEGWNLI